MTPRELAAALRGIRGRPDRDAFKRRDLARLMDRFPDA
jgi:hypothetical protein